MRGWVGLYRKHENNFLMGNYWCWWEFGVISLKSNKCINFFEDHVACASHFVVLLDASFFSHPLGFFAGAQFVPRKYGLAFCCWHVRKYFLSQKSRLINVRAVQTWPMATSTSCSLNWFCFKNNSFSKDFDKSLTALTKIAKGLEIPEKKKKVCGVGGLTPRCPLKTYTTQSSFSCHAS